MEGRIAVARDIKRRIKLLAAAREMTMIELVELLLTEALEREEKKGSKK